MNISQILLDQIGKQPNSCAIRYSEGFLTYEQFGNKVLQASTGLSFAGISAGDVVAVSLTDPLDHWCATLALAHRGATVFSLSTSMPEAQIREILKLINCSFILIEGTNELDHTRPPSLLWSEIKSESSINSYAPASIDAKLPWIFVTGSGSTGRPKIMPISHEQQVYRSSLGKDWLPYGQSDTLMSLVAPHFYASKQRYLETIAIGGAIFLDIQGKINHVREVENGEVTVIYGTVWHIETLLQSLEQNSKALYERLQSLMLGGSVVSMRLRKEIHKRLTKNLYVLWGSNESHTATITRLPEVFSTDSTVGRPLPGVHLEIVDNNDKNIPPFTTGAVRLKSLSSIDGYLGDPEATLKVFRHGWFYPGDVGFLTNDGQFVHQGRSDDMMLVGGVNVYPIEVEECIRGFPGVLDALVTPLRHQQIQDLPVALVVSSSENKISKQGLIHHVHNKIGKYKLYDFVEVNQIPRNEQGKIQQDVVLTILQSTWGEKLSSVKNLKKSNSNSSSHAEFLSLKFKCDPDRDTNNVISWILILDEELVHDIGSLTSQDNFDKVLFWLRQVLALSRGLLNALRVPIFEPLTFFDFRLENAERLVWHAKSRLPDQFLVPPQVYRGVVSASFDIAAWCLNKSTENSEHCEKFYSLINEKILKPFAALGYKGKSTYEILKVAHRRGIPYFSLPGGIFQLGIGANSRRIERSNTDRDSAFGMSLAHNKFFSAQLLRRVGLPAPKHAKVESLDQAQKVANQFKYPVVVKPVDLERGEGVSVDVFSADLEAALDNAKKKSPSKTALVECQVPGVCYRIFIAAESLLYAVRRLPLGIYGDGQSTISELISTQNELQRSAVPWKRSVIPCLDRSSIEMLKKQDFQPDSVPEIGKFVALRRIETTAWGGTDEEVTNEIHPDNIKAAILASKLFGLEVAGVDMISPDICKPWHENGAIINEVNYAPLLGGGDISRRYIDEYLRRILRNDGKIPVYTYGDSMHAEKAAKNHWNTLLSSGLRAFFTSRQVTLDYRGAVEVLETTDFSATLRALLMRGDVEALVVLKSTTSLE